MGAPRQSPHQHTNQLAHQTSPYLLQHAHNPVDWYPWGPQALAKAKAEDKPILLSIGYSACHWCHVMERESFEDEATAAIMNEHFVAIKVDREERPDLDGIYMEATVAFSDGQGGWPMTVFLTPDQHPFFAGTYFPPMDAYGRPGFPKLLRRIGELWKTRREDLTAQGADVVRALREAAQERPEGVIDQSVTERAVQQLADGFDSRWGGFGSQPKFPPSTSLVLLLAHARTTGDRFALQMATKTLDMMAAGGMYDHLAGGFCRYSVDNRWLVPHFEKMLYDNGLLARAYIEGFQTTGEQRHLKVARQILDYLLAEMQDPSGGFYSATDADSEGEEGKFFVWTPTQVEQVLGKDRGRAFCAAYDITTRGNFEGKSIPNTPRPLEQVATELRRAPAELETELEESRQALYQARRTRVPPGLDDKVITAWNGMAIAALSEGYRATGDERYVQGAQRAADFLLSVHRSSDGRLLRTSRAGRAHLAAYLEDYAFLTEALTLLYEASGQRRYLTEAVALATRLQADFGDPAGGAFFETAAGHEALIVRRREGHDGATPSGNAVAATALAKLGWLLDDAQLRASAQAAVDHFGGQASRTPRAFSQSLLAAQLLRDGPVEVVLVGDRSSQGYAAMERALGRTYLPLRAIVHHDPRSGEAPVSPLAQGKRPTGDGTAYICRRQVCSRPVTTAEGLVEQLLTTFPTPAA